MRTRDGNALNLCLYPLPPPTRKTNVGKVQIVDFWSARDLWTFGRFYFPRSADKDSNIRLEIDHNNMYTNHVLLQGPPLFISLKYFEFNYLLKLDNNRLIIIMYFYS